MLQQLITVVTAFHNGMAQVATSDGNLGTVLAKDLLLDFETFLEASERLVKVAILGLCKANALVQISCCWVHLTYRCLLYPQGTRINVQGDLVVFELEIKYFSAHVELTGIVGIEHLVHQIIINFSSPLNPLKVSQCLDYRTIWSGKNRAEIFVVIKQAKHLLKIQNVLVVNLNFGDKLHVLLVRPVEQHVIEKIAITAEGRCCESVLRLDNVSFLLQELVHRLHLLNCLTRYTSSKDIINPTLGRPGSTGQIFLSCLVICSITRFQLNNLCIDIIQPLHLVDHCIQQVSKGLLDLIRCLIYFS
mmetsp:Transcript_25035/g.69055  ORF Transcript_25035/g.69055 Transcript_25035/m.69055 type:complete len:304 (-) Transcript_25035:649-1560(-)